MWGRPVGQCGAAGGARVPRGRCHVAPPMPAVAAPSRQRSAASRPFPRQPHPCVATTPRNSHDWPARFEAPRPPSRQRSAARRRRGRPMRRRPGGDSAGAPGSAARGRGASRAAPAQRRIGGRAVRCEAGNGSAHGGHHFFRRGRPRRHARLRARRLGWRRLGWRRLGGRQRGKQQPPHRLGARRKIGLHPAPAVQRGEQRPGEPAIDRLSIYRGPAARFLGFMVFWHLGFMAPENRAH
jgi:hypothetical protein